MKNSVFFIVAVPLLLAFPGCRNLTATEPDPLAPRLTIEELEDDFSSAELYAMVVAPGLIYAGEVTDIGLVLNKPVTLEGMEFLVNLEIFELAYTGVDTEPEVRPLYSLSRLAEMTLWESPPVGQDVRDALTSALPGCVFDFGGPVP